MNCEYVYVFMGICVHVSVGALRLQKKASYPLDLELQVGVHCLMKVVETKFEIS